MSNEEYKNAITEQELVKLRDKYAGYAMQGILATLPTVHSYSLSDGTMLSISDAAYAMANAMLVARGEAL